MFWLVMEIVNGSPSSSKLCLDERSALAEVEDLLSSLELSRPKQEILDILKETSQYNEADYSIVCEQVGSPTHIAVLTRTCHVANSVDSWLFPSEHAAKRYCFEHHNVSTAEWEAFEVSESSSGELKLNGKQVRYTGWQFELPTEELLTIHLRDMTHE